MRRRYPVRTNETSQRAMNPSRIPLRGGGFTMLAIEEVVQLPSHHGLVATRRLKILRLNDAPSNQGQPVAPHAQVARLAPAPAPSVTRSRRELAEPTSKPQRTECLLNGKQVGLRSVGEVVTDEQGNFYEVHDQKLRLLGDLVRDERGNMFEVDRSTEERTDDVTNARSGTAPLTESVERSRTIQTSKTEKNTNQSSGPKPDGNGTGPRPSRAGVETQPPYRKILADPGLYLEIPFGRVKDEIAPQLTHPERLNDNSLIECYAQIYEAQRTMPVASLAAAEFGDCDLQYQLHPLTRRDAELLGVPQLFRPTRHPLETQASTRRIHAGQRLYRLWPVFDPTAAELASETKARSMSQIGEHEEGRSLISRFLRNPFRWLKALIAVLTSETHPTQEFDRRRS